MSKLQDLDVEPLYYLEIVNWKLEIKSQSVLYG